MLVRVLILVLVLFWFWFLELVLQCLRLFGGGGSLSLDPEVAEGRAISCKKKRQHVALVAVQIVRDEATRLSNNQGNRKPGKQRMKKKKRRQ